MRIKILTLFPEIFSSYLNNSIIGRAIDSGVLTVELINFRDYSSNKHRKTDDYPYGGGAGMVLSAQPIYDCLQEHATPDSQIVFLTPKGQRFTQNTAKKLGSCSDIILICGHYEDFDARLFELVPHSKLSIGDFILTSGELPAMVILDAVSRHAEGCITEESLAEESFEEGLLEYDHYTRPAEYQGLVVPPVLLSGHDKAIAKWRRLSSIANTYFTRPELLKTAKLTDTEKQILRHFLKD